MDAFERLFVWKRSCSFCVTLHRTPATCRDFGYRDQVTRAALPVPANIAEGYERNSRKGFARLPKIAKGSSAELRTQLCIGAQMGIMDRQFAQACIGEYGETARMPGALIAKLRTH